MWPNPLQYFLVPDVDVGENGIEDDDDEDDDARYHFMHFHVSIMAFRNRLWFVLGQCRQSGRKLPKVYLCRYMVAD